MKQKFLLLLACMLSAVSAWAQNENYDFEAVNDDGVTLYYKITSTTDPLTCEIVRKSEKSADKYTAATINIPSSVTYEGNPYSVTSIGAQAFLYCSNLTSIDIPNSVTSIGNGAFYCCTSLKSVTIPNSVSSLGLNVFLSCSKLKDVTLSNTLTEIPENTFSCCQGITTIDIPSSVTTIGKNAFSMCNKLTSLSIPETVTSIGEEAFRNCNQINTLEINGIVSIGNNAFESCDNLTDVTINSTTPPTLGSDVFKVSNPENLNINVPLESVTTYQNAPGWSDLSDNIKAIVPPVCLYDGNSTGVPYNSLDEVTKSATNALIFTTDEYDEATAVPNVVYKNSTGDWVAKEINLTDGQPFYCPENVEVGTLKYTRTFGSSSLRALYVPFSMSYSDWEEDFNIYRLNAYYEIDTDYDGLYDDCRFNVTLVTDNNGDLLPNHPYIISAKVGDSTTPKVISLTNTTLYATVANSVECSSVETNNIFTGNYQKVEKFATNKYYRMNYGSLCQADDDTYNLPAFSWYMKMESKDGQFVPNPPASISIVVGGGTTEIEEIVSEEANEGAVFNLQGQRVGADYKGIVIMNGKKVIRR